MAALYGYNPRLRPTESQALRDRLLEIVDEVAEPSVKTESIAESESNIAPSTPECVATPLPTAPAPFTPQCHTRSTPAFTQTTPSGINIFVSPTIAVRVNGPGM